jgi:8-oxo-dGTP pyrophosphatase MutT (NUDIX family)
MWVAAEQRAKTNEFLLARPDISSVLLYQPAQRLDDIRVVLVREFRSPARTPDGFVWELPGGSSMKPGLEGAALASEEVREETGLAIAAGRLRSAASRQLAATFSSHHAHLYTAALTATELAAAAGVHGVAADSERTSVHVVTVGEIRARSLVDWSTMGMILSALA